MKVKTAAEMLGTQPMKVAQLRPELSAKFTDLLTDPAHNIAWTPDVSHLIHIKSTGTHSLLPDLALETAALPVKEDAASAAQRKEITNTFLAVTTLTGDLVKHEFPKLEGAVGGFECVVTSYQAFEAWSDPNRTSVVQPTLKTAQALVSALDVLKAQLPLGISSRLQTIGLLVEIGDEVYQVYLAIKGDASPQQAQERL